EETVTETETEKKRDTLQKNRVLTVTRSKICAEVSNALDDEPETVIGSRENLLSNKLTWKYLEFEKSKYTASSSKQNLVNL
uniref:Uncharacterized protein n=1 Tax=Peromyscus maniculatus bairdii TaxID=230844 RepID=A0A8C8UAH6_PERMB